MTSILFNRFLSAFWHIFTIVCWQMQYFEYFKLNSLLTIFHGCLRLKLPRKPLSHIYKPSKFSIMPFGFFWLGYTFDIVKLTWLPQWQGGCGALLSDVCIITCLQHSCHAIYSYTGLPHLAIYRHRATLLCYLCMHDIDVTLFINTGLFCNAVIYMLLIETNNSCMALYGYK